MRLIDKDALMAQLKAIRIRSNDLTIDYKRGHSDGIITAVEYADDATTVDAVPVVRGKWIHGCSDGAGTEFCYCSECSEDALKDKGGYTEFSAYCPNCGCDMRGESNDIRGGF